MKSGMRITSNLPKWFLLTLVLTLAPAALASTWYVDGVNGNDSNDCLSSQTACQTIGRAIALCSSGDSIRVAPATYMENLTIGISLKIIGSDAKTTIVDGGGLNTVVTNNSPTNVILSKLTIRNGYSQFYGGGIINAGTLTVIHSTITANSANYGGGGIFNMNMANLTIKNNSTISENGLSNEYGSGGGIFNEGTLTVNRSTITANSASDGGGVCSPGGVVVINRSTLSGNSATWGGAIDFTGGTATINNSTLSGNSATDAGGGIGNYVALTINNSTMSGNRAAAGGGILQVTGGSATFQNSIIANNSGGNCLTEPDEIYSNGYNLSSDNTCSFYGLGDMNNTKPKLGKFGDHGGPTQTIPLLPGSPAIDAGNPTGCTDDKGNLLKTDQRGYARPGKYDQDKRCDIGAFERQHD